MTQLTDFRNVPLEIFYQRLRENKSNPSAMFAVAGSLLEEVTDGRVTFVDPTNPAVFLAEFAATATSVAINENIANLRRSYASLSETPKDLYYDMADVDYVNRFSSPAIVPITIMLGLESLLRDMVRDDSERCTKAIIPRDSYFTAGPYTFTMLYPIVVRYYDSGTLEISYDATIKSPFQELETNIIPYTQVNTADDVRMLMFEVPVHQLLVVPHNAVIQKSAPFVMSLSFVDQFFYARAFHKSSATANWEEIRTTHSDFVYDHRFPTILLEVVDQTLTAKLPIIYTSLGMTGEIMLLVYTSKGQVTDNLASYDFTPAIRAIDEPRDLSIYTSQSLRNVPFLAVSGAMMTGGKNSLSFEELRERVIFNSQGVQQLPITTAQAQAMLENNGFTLTREIDVITNRVFLAHQNLPKPRDPRLLTAANIGIETFITDRASLEDHPFVYLNGRRWTLSPRNLYQRVNGVVKLMSWQTIQDINAMELTARVSHLNTHHYLYTPFHYVYDQTDSKFAMHAYYLDKPLPGLINFAEQNETLSMAVNTGSRIIERTENGYRLLITTTSGANYKNTPDSQVGAQLMFYPSRETIPVYLKGTLVGRDAADERVFAFDLNTNYDLSVHQGQHRLRILQVGVSGDFDQNVWVDLLLQAHIFHCTNSITVDYQPNASNQLFGRFQFGPDFVPITQEILTLRLGYALDNLWTRARSLSTGYHYKKHLYDIPMLYDRDVYETDSTGSLVFQLIDGEAVFNKLHQQGEPVLDDQGQPVMKYIAGTPVIDPQTGLPMLEDALEEKKEVDILFIDGRHYFVNDSVYLAYNQELVDTLVTWITEDLEAVKGRLLDQTKVFFYPRSQISYADIETQDGFIHRIDSEQSPKIDLYVRSAVLRNEEIRQMLVRSTVQVLDDYLSRREINVSDMITALKEAYADAVISFRLSGFGAGKDLSYALVVRDTQRVAIRRILAIQADSSLIMTEDLEINFLRVENKL